nr:TetR/AcrR family transcriptional regulator [Paenibacillus cellulosilyticus]
MSFTDLTQVTGVERPALYSAFGNKEALFRRVLASYCSRVPLNWTLYRQIRRSHEPPLLQFKYLYNISTLHHSFRKYCRS